VSNADITILYDGKSTTFSFDLLNAADFSLTNNTFHIHQRGILPGQNCTDTGGHYNPVKNYGELSGKWKNLTIVDREFNFTDNDVKLEGPYNILGRSIVIHDASGARIACCNIRLDVDSLTSIEEADPMYTTYECNDGNVDYSISFSDSNTANINVSVDNALQESNNAMYIQQIGDCDSTDVLSRESLNVSFSQKAGDSAFNTTGGFTFANLTDLAGRSIVRVDSNTMKVAGCCNLVQTTFQTNVNDKYVEPNATGTSSSSMSTSQSTTSQSMQSSTTENSNVSSSSTSAQSSSTSGQAESSNSAIVIVSILLSIIVIMI